VSGASSETVSSNTLTVFEGCFCVSFTLGFDGARGTLVVVITTWFGISSGLSSTALTTSGGGSGTTTGATRTFPANLVYLIIGGTIVGEGLRQPGEEHPRLAPAA
jgi:hypothetical protein